MVGRHHVTISNNFLKYEFDIVRNITVIEGNSATGKTSLVDMIRTYRLSGLESGISLTCDKRCTVLEGLDWKEQLTLIKDSIVFIDEGNRFVETEDFASTIKNSDNYYVIVTRERLDQLPYSVSEIYGIHSSGKYNDLRQTYNQLYRIYGVQPVEEMQPDLVIVEDSNAGYDFFKSIFTSCECVSAEGKSNIYKKLIENIERKKLVIADGAAFGSEMSRIMLQVKSMGNCSLYLPESFEWLILKSGLIDGNRVRNILEHPEDYIESMIYFSWERFFTKLLVDESGDSYLAYKKGELNPAYLHEKEKNRIVETIPVNMEPISK